MNLEIQGQSCPTCGISGIHACPGKRLPSPTPEEETRLKELVDKIRDATFESFKTVPYEQATGPQHPPVIRATQEHRAMVEKAFDNLGSPAELKPHGRLA